MSQVEFLSRQGAVGGTLSDAAAMTSELSSDGRDIKRAMDERGVSFKAFKAALMKRKRRSKLTDEAVYGPLRGKEPLSPEETLLWWAALEESQPDREPIFRGRPEFRGRSEDHDGIWQAVVDAARSLGQPTTEILGLLRAASQEQRNHILGYLRGFLVKK